MANPIKVKMKSIFQNGTVAVPNIQRVNSAEKIIGHKIVAAAEMKRIFPNKSPAMTAAAVRNVSAAAIFPSQPGVTA